VEPLHTAILLVFAAVLLLLSALATRLSGRVGVPSLLFFLLLGTTVRLLPGHLLNPPGSRLSFEIGTVALVLILFDGGLNITAAAARSVAGPTLALAVPGTVISALLVALVGWLTGLAWSVALLVGAIVSSTDAAAVFAALRGGHTRLRERVSLVLELESALNDPMAVILTVAATDVCLGQVASPLGIVAGTVWQVLAGSLIGLTLGLLGRRLLARAALPATGLYPVLTVSIALGSYGLATLIDGSGFFAVAVAACTLGSGPLPYRPGLLRVHDALAWLSQIVMFVILGLTVTPAELVAQAGRGALLAVALAVFARPLAVFLCLAPFRFHWRERLFIALNGLRGAVPIVLATYPMIRGVPNAAALFDLVFVMVAFNSIIPGAVTGPLSRWLDLRESAPPAPPAGIEMISRNDYDGAFVSYYISRASAVAGAEIQEIPLPESSVMTLIVRGRHVIAPRGGTRLQAGDHAYLFVTGADRPLVDLLFGAEE
jgi:cell volume regulation protein A